LLLEARAKRLYFLICRGSAAVDLNDWLCDDFRLFAGITLDKKSRPEAFFEA
jgi:hypothetical protein